MKGKGFFFILCVCMTFISCSNVAEDKNDVRSNASVLKFLDIQNAKNLYIGTSNSGTRSAGDSATTQKLFKITEDGYVEEVKYLDENKKEITISQQPAVIQTVNEEYIFVGFGWSDSISTSYLVRKTDGAVFDMTKAGNPEQIQNRDWIQTDRNNNMYYLTYISDTFSRKIVKINLNDSSLLGVTTVSASTDDVREFKVDWNGNVFYNERIRKLNGSFENCEPNFSFSTSWIGLDGNLYYLSYNDGQYGTSNYSYAIKKMEIDNSYKINYEICGYSDNITNLDAFAFPKTVVQDKLFFIGGSEIYEVINDGADIRKVDLNLDMYIIQSTSTENFYYILGRDNNRNTVIIKVDPKTDNYTLLLDQNNYEVFSFTASETDGITFNALRMSDGKKIIGQVGINGGEVTILDEESDAEITYLQRIN